MMLHCARTCTVVVIQKLRCTHSFWSMYRSASSIHPSVSLINLQTVPIDVTCHLNTTLWGGKGGDGLETKLSMIRHDGTVVSHCSPVLWGPGKDAAMVGLTLPETDRAPSQPLPCLP